MLYFSDQGLEKYIFLAKKAEKTPAFTHKCWKKGFWFL